MTPDLQNLDKSAWEGCRACPRRELRYVPPRLVPSSQLLLVGEAPGEDERDEPFQGQAGRILDNLLNKAGTRRDLCSLANTVACYVPGNPVPTTEEVRCCAPILEAVVQQVQPRTIVPLGNTATARLLGARSITEWRGSVLASPQSVAIGDEDVPTEVVFKSGPRKGQAKTRKAACVLLTPAGRRVVPTFHPAELGYSGFANYPYVVMDLRRALHPDWDVPLGQHVEHYIDAVRLDQILRLHTRLVLDVETDGSQLSLVGLGLDEQHSITFSPDLVSMLAPWLANPAHLMLGHNLSFDIKQLHAAGLVVKTQLWDTMHGAHFARPDLEKRLERAASMLPRYKYWNWKEAYRTGQLSLEAYNALDTCWPWALYDHQRELFTRTNRLKHFTQVLMPALPVLIELEEQGVQIDQEALAKMAGEQEALAQQLAQRWTELHPDVNPASPKQLAKLLYDDLGLTKMTQRGSRKVTTDRRALEKLELAHPDVETMRVLGAWRHVEKIGSTYLNLELQHGRLYPQYNLSGTTTGRLSGGGDEGFNYQNIPRTTGDCPRNVQGCQCGHIRSLFVPDNGYDKVIVGDWSQIEYRISALLAGERSLIERYANDPGFSIHRDVAGQLGLEYDVAKRVVHGTNYGMKARKLAETTGLSVQQCSSFIDAFMQLYPALARWREMTVTFARKNGYVVNPFGRRIYIHVTPNGEVDAPVAIAAIPQSTAADMMIARLIDVRADGFKILWTVHDEIGVLKQRPDDVERLKRLMAMPFMFGTTEFSCPAEVGEGPNWAQAKH